jgi:hypothetical protein
MVSRVEARGRRLADREAVDVDGLAIRAYLGIGDDPDAALAELRDHYRRHPRPPGAPETLAGFLGLV